MEELEEMGGGGGVGCCRGGVWVEKMVVEVVNWKEMGKKKRVDLMVVLKKKEMEMVVLLLVLVRGSGGRSWDGASLAGDVAGGRWWSCLDVGHHGEEEKEEEERREEKGERKDKEKEKEKKRKRREGGCDGEVTGPMWALGRRWSRWEKKGKERKKEKQRFKK